MAQLIDVQGVGILSFPDGMPPQEIERLLKKDFFQDTPPAQPVVEQTAQPVDPVEPPEQMGEFGRGLARGTDELQAGLFGTAESLSGQLGFEDAEEYFKEGRLEQTAEAEQYEPPRVGSIYKVDSLDDAADWALSTLGSAIPSLGAVFGTAGAVAGTIALAPVTVPGLATTALVAGTGWLTSTAINAGDVYKTLLEEGVSKDDAQQFGLGAGGIMGALDSVPALKIITDIIKSPLKESIKKSAIRRITKDALKLAAVEGVTESAQEGVKMSAEALATGKPIPLEEVQERLVNSLAGGFLVGGTVGSATSTVSTAVRGRQARQEEEAQALRIPDDLEIPDIREPVLDDEGTAVKGPTLFDSAIDNFNALERPRLAEAASQLKEKDADGNYIFTPTQARIHMAGLGVIAETNKGKNAGKLDPVIKFTPQGIQGGGAGSYNVQTGEINIDPTEYPLSTLYHETFHHWDTMLQKLDPKAHRAFVGAFKRSNTFKSGLSSGVRRLLGDEIVNEFDGKLQGVEMTTQELMAYSLQAYEEARRRNILPGQKPQGILRKAFESAANTVGRIVNKLSGNEFKTQFDALNFVIDGNLTERLQSLVPAEKRKRKTKAQAPQPETPVVPIADPTPEAPPTTPIREAAAVQPAPATQRYEVGETVTLSSKPTAESSDSEFTTNEVEVTSVTDKEIGGKRERLYAGKTPTGERVQWSTLEEGSRVAVEPVTAELVAEPAPTEPVAAEPAPADPAQSGEVVAEFQTSRGSTYKQFKDGTTIRNRALSEDEDPSLGGEQPRSIDTVFIDDVSVKEIGGLLQNPEMPVKFERMPSRKNKRGRLVYTEDYGKIRKKGDPVPGTSIDISVKPEAGLTPLEIFDPETVVSQDGSNVHFGTRIISEGVFAPTIAAPAPTPTETPQTDLFQTLADQFTVPRDVVVSIADEINPQKFVNNFNSDEIFALRKRLSEVEGGDIVFSKLVNVQEPTAELYEASGTSSVQIRENRERGISQRLQETGTVLASDIAKAFDNYNRALVRAFRNRYRRRDLNDEAVFEDVKRSMVPEVVHQLGQDQSGLGWYDDDIKLVFETLSETFPVLNDPAFGDDYRRMFTVIAAITSNGTKAKANLFNASMIFAEWLRTGKLTVTNPLSTEQWGQRGKIVAGQLNMVNGMLNDPQFDFPGSNYPSFARVTDWMLEDHGVRDLNEMRARHGIKSGLTGLGINSMRRGAYMFGKKIGPFFTNLNGMHDETVDSWASRSVYRHLGRLFDDTIDDARSGPDVKDHEQIKRLLREVADDVSNETGVDLDSRNLQAVLWFYEKDLWNSLGYNTELEVFSDGAREFVEAYKNDFRQPAKSKRSGAEPSVQERQRTSRGRRLARGIQTSAGATSEGAAGPTVGGEPIGNTLASARVAQGLAYPAPRGTAQQRLGLSLKSLNVASFDEKGRPKEPDNIVYSKLTNTASQMREGRKVSLLWRAQELISGAKFGFKENGEPEYQDQIDLFNEDANQKIREERELGNIFYFGPQTGPTAEAFNVPFDPVELMYIPGMNGEHSYRNKDTEGSKLRRLKESIAREGYNPSENPQDNPIIYVRPKQFRNDGFAVIVEGNHRIVEAMQSERPVIYANITYFRSAEREPGIFNQDTLFSAEKTDLQFSKLTENQQATADKISDRSVSTVGSFYGAIRDLIVNTVSNRQEILAQTLDPYMAIARAGAERGYQLARVAHDTADMVAESLVNGVPKFTEQGREEYRDADGNIIRKPGLVKIIEPIAKMHGDVGMHLWGAYMYAYRARRLQAEGREKLLTPMEIIDLLDLGRLYPEFEVARQQYVDFNNDLLQFAVDGKYLTQNQAESWKRFGDYLPFYRLMQGDEATLSATPIGPTSGGVGRVGDPSRRLKGGAYKLNGIVPNMVRNAEALITKTMRNHAMRAIVNEIGPDTANPAMTETKRSKVVRKKTTVNEIKKTLEQVLGEDIAILEEQTDIDALEGLYDVFVFEPKMRDENVVTVRGMSEDTTETFYKVEDVDLFNALAHVPTRNLNMFMRFMNFQRNAFSQMITKMPDFLQANLVRDTLSTRALYSGYEPITNAIKGVGQSFTNPDLLREIRLNGGTPIGGYHRSSALRRYAKATGDSSNPLIVTAKNAWALVDRVSEATENANRLAVYQASRKQGFTKEESGFRAREVLDFSLRGKADKGAFKIVEYLITTVPFINARAQGAYRLARAGSPLSNNKNRLNFYATMGVMAGFATALYAINEDDERYQALPQESRDLYMHIYLDKFFPDGALDGIIDNPHIAIPKPFEAGFVGMTIPERLLAAARGAENAGSDFMDSLMFGVVNIFKINPYEIAGPIGKGIIQDVINKDTFRDRDIIPPYSLPLKGTADEGAGIADPRANEVTLALARETNFAAQRIQNALDSWAPKIGNVVMSLADVYYRQVNGLPPAPMEFKDTALGQITVGRFNPPEFPRYSSYEKRARLLINKEILSLDKAIKNIEKNNKTDPGGIITGMLAERGLDAQFVSRAQKLKKDLNQLNKDRRAIYNAAYPEEKKGERLKQLRRIDQLRAHISKNFLSQYGKEQRAGAN